VSNLQSKLIPNTRDWFLENIVQFSQAARRIDMLNIRKLFMVTVWLAAFQSSPYVNAAVYILDS
jgi:hypothetical protein